MRRDLFWRYFWRCAGLGFTMLPAIGLADVQSVLPARDRPPIAANAPPATGPTKAMLGLSPATRSAPSDAAPSRVMALPANLIYVEISREYLAKCIATNVYSDDPVVDDILGTSLNGWAHTSGVADLVLEENSQQATAQVVFAGTSRSHTLGRNGPIMLHNEAETTFLARKQLVLGEEGLRALPAVTRATTRSTTTDIDTSLPGLRGRLARRIAWDRVAQTQARAEEIASRHAEARLGRALDERVQASLAAVQTMISMKAPQVSFGNDAAPPRIRFSSTPTHVRIVVYRADASLAERELAPPPIPGNPEIAVALHRAVVLRAMTEPAILGPLAAQMVGAKPVAQATPEISSSCGPQYQTVWSPKHDWLMITSSGRPSAAPVAAK